MLTNQDSAIEIITKLNLEGQNQRLRLFAKVDITTKLKILSSQKQLFHKLKANYSDVDNTILTLSALILAVDAIVQELENINLNAIKFRVKSTKMKIKRAKVLGYWAIIRTLKLEQNMSFRQITEYLKKYHKLSVAHSTLHSIWNELEQ